MVKRITKKSVRETETLSAPTNLVVVKHLSPEDALEYLKAAIIQKYGSHEKYSEHLGACSSYISGRIFHNKVPDYVYEEFGISKILIFTASKTSAEPLDWDT